EAWVREACGADTAFFEETTPFFSNTKLPAPPRRRKKSQCVALAQHAVRLLGRGGMGTVYLANRADGAFRMQAAIKVVPLALASPDIEVRFRRERQFLASLGYSKGMSTSAKLPGVAAFTATTTLSRLLRKVGHC